MCSLKYRFQYIDELPKTFKSSGLAFGSVMHSSLEWFHKEMMKGKEIPIEALYKIFEVDWYAQKADVEIRFKDSEDDMRLMVLGKEFLTLYYNAPLRKIKGAEISFHNLPLSSNGDKLDVPLEGFIDLVEEDDTIVEFKTSARKIDAQTLKDQLQLTAYSYAYEMLFRKRPKSLKIINFVKSRTPKMHVLETTRTQADYEKLFSMARDVLKGIRAEIFFPRQSFMCKDCEYGGPCQTGQRS